MGTLRTSDSISPGRRRKPLTIPILAGGSKHGTTKVGEVIAATPYNFTDLTIERLELADRNGQVRLSSTDYSANTGMGRAQQWYFGSSDHTPRGSYK